jgi:hypothetical protein
MSELQNIRYLTMIKQRPKITCRYEARCDRYASKEWVNTDTRTALMGR